MKHSAHWILAATVATAIGLSQQAPPASVTNVVVYQQPGRFGGWPANHGIWSWGNEILVGLEAGYFRTNDRGGHAIDYTKPAEHLLARSLDGGATWKIEKPEGLKPPPGERQAGVPTEIGRPVADFTGRLDFTKPGFALTPAWPTSTPARRASTIPRTRANPGRDPFACRTSANPASPRGPTI